MLPVFIHRLAAADLTDYWSEVDVHSDDSEFALDNADSIEDIRRACLALERAQAAQKNAMILVELDDRAAKELLLEATDHMEAAKDHFHELHPQLEQEQSRLAWKLVRHYRQLMKQLTALGVDS